MDQDLLNDDDEPSEATEKVKRPVPWHIKVLAGTMVLLVGVALGSTGHALYTQTAVPTTNELQAIGSMFSRMNVSASPCSEMYKYSCGGYVENHLPFGGASVFNDFSEEATAAAYHAFRTYVKEEPNAAASLFYNRCMAAGPQDKPNCTIAGTPGPDLLKNVWMHGYSANGLYVDRTVSPYEPNTRSFAVFLDTYTAGDVRRPENIEQFTDPCNLFSILQLMYDCTVCEDYNILLYGDTQEICERWKSISLNVSDASAASRDDAAAECVQEMKYRYSVKTCIRHTSMFYPTVSKAYVDAVQWGSHSTMMLFKTIRDKLVHIVAPLGPKVVEKVKSVKLYDQWSAQNLNPGPSKIVLESEDSYASLFLKLLYSKTAESLRSRTMVAPVWHMNSYSINAYYQPSENSIYIPDAMGALKRGVEFPAALAFIIAHELSHSIDPSSISYNENGMYDQLLSVDGEQFYNRFVKCIQTRPKQLSEDFADRVATQIVSAIAPGISSTLTVSEVQLTFPQQMVLQMSQLWCQAESVETYDDSHSPSRLRVEESMSSLFTHEFGCAEQQTCILG